MLSGNASNNGKSGNMLFHHLQLLLKVQIFHKYFISIKLLIYLDIYILLLYPIVTTSFCILLPWQSEILVQTFNRNVKKVASCLEILFISNVV